MKMKYCNGIQSFPAGANETSRKKKKSRMYRSQQMKRKPRQGWPNRAASLQIEPRRKHCMAANLHFLTLPKNQFMKNDVIQQEAQCSKSCWSLGFLAHHLAFLAHQAVCTGTKQLHGAVRSTRAPPPPPTNLGCTSPDNSPAHQLLSLTTGGRLPGNRTPPPPPRGDSAPNCLCK